MLNHFLNANRRYLFLINHPSCQIKRYKNDYSKTLNLPNCGKFELSMKRICEHEDNIKKVHLDIESMKKLTFDPTDSRI